MGFENILTPQGQRILGYDRSSSGEKGKVDTIETVPMGRVQPAHMGSQSEAPDKE